MFWNMFSSGNTIEKATDAVISAGDKLVYTQEEKADMNLKLKEFHIRTLEAYHPFKVTQRFLAIWYSFLFGMAFLIGLGVAVINMYLKYENAETILIDMTPLLDVIGAFGLGGIVMAIVIFYFGGGSIESFKNTFKSK